MCGIFAWLNPPGKAVDLAAARRAIRSMAHRGPDGYGEWLSDDGSVYLGHRRLSILDLSDNARQPMLSPSGQHVLIYNGELYNYRPLRDRLESLGAGPVRSTGDTEVLLHSIVTWRGDCLAQLDGMFAFAVWDAANGTLFCARDHFGIKPLYVYHCPSGAVAIASESKAFWQLPEFQAAVNQAVLPEFLRYRNLVGGSTLLAGVTELLPGHTLEVRQGQEPRVHQYWRLPGARHSPQATTDRLAQLVKESVAAQLVSDVPVGVQLSGGIDSSLIATLAARESGQTMEAFHCHVHSAAVDERPFAAAVAKAAGMRLNLVELTSQNFFDLLVPLTWHMDEPIAHPNSVGIYLVSRLAKERVKVLLSGEGADELFGGYTRYSEYLIRRALRRGFSLPALAAAAALGRRPANVRSMLRSNRGRSDTDLILRGYVYLDDPLLEKLLGPSAASDAVRLRRQLVDPAEKDALLRCQRYDLLAYLPQLLIRQDKMSMAASIENRVPLLTCDLAGHMASLETRQKATMFRTKVQLKTVARRYLPPGLVDRRKWGFGIPLGNWLREPAGREATHDYLLDPNARFRSFIDDTWVRATISAANPLTGREAEAIWLILALEIWLRGLPQVGSEPPHLGGGAEERACLAS